MPVKPAEPAAETDAHPGALAQALDCLARGDNRCVIRALEDKADSARELELLIATYRTVGSTPRAEKEMKRYIERFPNGPRAAEYQRVLERRAPTGESSPEANP